MPPPPHSRFAINVPAAVGVAAVFVVAVAAWVVASRMGGDEVSGPDRTIPPASLVSTPTTAPATTAASGSTTSPQPTSPQQTSPVPLPTNVPKQGITTTTVAGGQTAATTTTQAPARPTTTTTVAGAANDGQTGGAGDLGVEGHPIEDPTCDGAFVTIIASVIGEGDAAATSVSQQLSLHPQASYLRTDQSCSSFRQDVDGEPIYVVYFGPFAQPGDACEARADTDSESYIKRLTNGDDAGPGCDEA